MCRIWPPRSFSKAVTRCFLWCKQYFPISILSSASFLNGSAAHCSTVSSWNSRHLASASETPWYCALVEIACEEDLPKLWMYCRRFQTKSYTAKLDTAKHQVRLVLIRQSWNNFETNWDAHGVMPLFTVPGTKQTINRPLTISSHKDPEKGQRAKAVVWFSKLSQGPVCAEDCAWLCLCTPPPDRQQGGPSCNGPGWDWGRIYTFFTSIPPKQKSYSRVCAADGKQSEMNQDRKPLGLGGMY